MLGKMSAKVKSVSDALNPYITIITFITLAFEIANRFLKFIQDPETLKYIAIISYILFTLVLANFVVSEFIQQKSKRIRELIFILLLTILLFVWVGTWIPKEWFDLKVVPIENNDITAFSYWENGSSYLKTNSKLIEGRNTNFYRMDLNIPVKKQAIAGMAIMFEQPIDLSKFLWIQFHLSYEDKPAPIFLSLKDAAGNQQPVIIGNGRYGDLRSQEQVITVPITDFSSTTLRLIKYVDFYMDETLNLTDVNDDQHHIFNIGQIQFLKTSNPGSAPTLAPAYELIPTPTPINEPQFDINVLSYTTQTDTFEVTNNMIDEVDKLMQPDNDYGVASANLKLEVHPNYNGDRTYGDVSLRITGATGKPIIRHLWNDFSKLSQAVKIEVTLQDMIELSGVKYLDDAPATNVQAGENAFPTYPVTFDVIRTSDASQPFQGKKVISVVNTPWVQYAKLARREGHWFIDYYVKNLGRDGSFGYYFTLVKTVRPVGESGHPIWSGTEEVQEGQSSQPFLLKTGEEHLESIAINDNLPRGRYIGQVYTYKIPDFVEFRSPVDWSNYGDSWVFANGGDKPVFVICQDPGKTCSQTASDPIEQHGIAVDSYSGSEQGKDGWVYYQAGAYPADDHIATKYEVSYQLDPAKEGWAGLAIGIQKGNDFSSYHDLRFHLQFLDDASKDGIEPPIWIYVISTDPETKKESRSRVKIGDGTYGDNTTDEQVIEIPLKDLENTDLKHITEIDISSDNQIVTDTIRHEFVISGIEFVDTTQ